MKKEESKAGNCIVVQGYQESSGFFGFSVAGIVGRNTTMSLCF